MLNYADVLNDISCKDKISLLIGNGFSIAFDSKFCIPEQDFFSSSQKQKRNDAISIHFVKGKVSQLKIDKNDFFFNEIVKVHPKGICEIQKKAVDNCFSFLEPYLKKGNIFTLCYDLLLYWASIKNGNGPDNLYNDGFTKKNTTGNGWLWEEEKANVFYCHGALNLYENKKKTFKLAHDQYCFKPIKEGIGIKKPLIVSGDTATNKICKIRSNEYLTKCYEKIENSEGAIVLLGLSFINDWHILDALRNAQKNYSTKIYYGLYQISDKEIMESKFINAGIEVQLFDSKTLSIWGK